VNTSGDPRSRRRWPGSSECRSHQAPPRSLGRDVAGPAAADPHGMSPRPRPRSAFPSQRQLGSERIRRSSGGGRERLVWVRSIPRSRRSSVWILRCNSSASSHSLLDDGHERRGIDCRESLSSGATFRASTRGRPASGVPSFLPSVQFCGVRSGPAVPLQRIDRGEFDVRELKAEDVEVLGDP